MRVICIAGARPNFMKVAPILVALEAAGIEGLLVHTGQHYDAAMSEHRTPDHRRPRHEPGSGHRPRSNPKRRIEHSH